MLTYILHRVSTNSFSTVGQKYCCCGKQFLYGKLRAVSVLCQSSKGHICCRRRRMG